MKQKTFFFIVTFIVAFGLYAFTANPDVTFTDNGELAGVLSVFGVAHPTGYPLFTMLGHLWAMLPHPFENIFWLNLFASFTTALSAGVFFLIADEIYEMLDMNFKNVLVQPFSIAFIYIVAKTIWEQGLSLEVYSLQLLMFNLIILGFLKVINSDKPDRWLLLTALFAGLGFANHMTTILIMPGLLVAFFMLKNEKSAFLNNKLKSLLILAIPFLAGLSLYISLPLISSGEPAFNWGAVHRSLDKFLYHVQGKQYQIWMFSGSEVAGANLIKFFSLVPEQLGWVGIIFSGIGLVAVFKYNKTIATFLIVSLLSCVLYSINYSIHDIDAYFSLAFIVLIILLIFSIRFLAEKKWKIYSWISIVAGISIVLNMQTNNRSDDILVKEYMTVLADELDKDAVILSAQWDFWCSAFWYYQQVEGYRSDVKLIEKELLRRTWYPLQLRNWYPVLCEKCESQISLYEEQLELFESDEKYNPALIQQRFENMQKCFIESNINEKPVYITYDIIQTEPNLIKDYELVPEGFAFRVYPKGTEKEPFVDIDKLNGFIKSARKYNKNHLERGIIENASQNLTNAARLCVYQGNIEQARIYFEMALEIDKNNLLASQSLNQINQRK
jgi:hypothetical protein